MPRGLVRPVVPVLAASILAGRPRLPGGAAPATRPSGRRDEFRRATVDGTRRLLEAARAAGVGRFVHVGAEAVCFDGGDLVDLDESRPLPARHRNDCCGSKAEGERLVLAATEPGRFETIALRPAWVWGPGDTNALLRMVELVKAGKFGWVDGGRAVRTTTHVTNLVEAIRLEAAFMRAQVSVRCDLARKEPGWRAVVTVDEGLAGLSH